MFLFGAYLVYYAIQGFIAGEIIIAGKRKSVLITGDSSYIASTGVFLVGLGLLLRTVFDTTGEYEKFFTPKSIPFWIGVMLILISIFSFNAQ